MRHCVRGTGLVRGILMRHCVRGTGPVLEAY